MARAELPDRLWSPSYLRIAAQLLGFFFLCLAGCWLLNRVVRSRPTVISGKVIDWNTGQPVRYTDVDVVRWNHSDFVVRTDAAGAFTFQIPGTAEAYFLFASDPRYGKLLQARFGQTVVVYGPGERIRDVLVPAIPAAGLSGHVYGSEGQPISGCDVTVVTRDEQFPDDFVRLDVVGVQASGYQYLEADTPKHVLFVGSTRTKADGSYNFEKLAGDRYFVLANCKDPARYGAYPRFIWEPVAYPQATSIAKAQEILLLPGKHRADIDFHMQRKRSYALEGKVSFSDGSTANPWHIYPHDVRIFRSDQALPTFWSRPEECNWNTDTGNLRCVSLLPGRYTLSFSLSASSLQPSEQFARVSYTVEDNAKQQPLKVQLHGLPRKPPDVPKTGPSGYIDLGKVCGAAKASKPQVDVLMWGRGHAATLCYFASFLGETRRSLPEGTYTVNAYEAAFSLGQQSKFEAILMRRGVRVHIRAGHTSKPVLPVHTTSDLIDIALDSLRQSP
jgi:hypothetical protein